MKSIFKNEIIIAILASIAGKILFEGLEYLGKIIPDVEPLWITISILILLILILLSIDLSKKIKLEYSKIVEKINNIETTMNNINNKMDKKGYSQLIFFIIVVIIFLILLSILKKSGII